MTASLQLVSELGNHATEEVTQGTKVTLRIFLTDLPMPSAFDLYLNGKLIEQQAWNSGIGYEYNTPINTNKAGTYIFKAKVYFVDGQQVPTNTVKLTVLSLEVPSVVSTTHAVSTAQVSVPTISLSTDDKIAIGAGIGAVAIIGGILFMKYKK